MSAVSAALTVRVWVPDVWDTVTIAASADWTVERLKAEALQAATGRSPDPRGYRVKFRGGLVLDEQQTLDALDAPDRAPFIVLPARRHPVR